ncbi:hypothetical protein G9444_1230 [Rhodococcus erythropolis]|uniref:Uncharacterized protein n=1 Tax=Rhodococcus erythropolis TaxID=1833 RepID=A0A6G9CNI4_RHOER|nr:hypothetical protein G9444_1230 [Rhodococcus erythropolis]
MLGGSHDAASESDFFWLVGPVDSAQVSRVVGQIGSRLRVELLRALLPGVRECDNM